MLHKIQRARRSRHVGIILALLLLTLGLEGCMKYTPITVEQMGSPRLNLGADSGVQLTLPLQVRNPNPYAVVLREGEVDLFFEGRAVCHGVLTASHVELPAEQTQWVRLPMLWTFNSPGDELRFSLLGKRLMNKMEIEGNFRLKMGSRPVRYRLKRTPLSEVLKTLEEHGIQGVIPSRKGEKKTS